MPYSSPNYCAWCGEHFEVIADAADRPCENEDEEPLWCADCGAELTDVGTCLNDHTEDDAE